MYFGERLLQGAFRHWGMFVGAHAVQLLIVLVAMGVGLSTGLASLQVETDPERLWSRPDSVAAVNKRHFEDAFGPLFRTAMLIVTPLASQSEGEGEVSGGGFLTDDLFAALFDVHEVVSAVKAATGNGSATTALGDVCYRTLTGGACLVESPLQWWALDRVRFEADEDPAGHAHACLSHYDCYSCVQYTPPLNCIGAEGVPADPRVVLGGFGADPDSGVPQFDTARAAISTYLLNGELASEAVAWEEAFEAEVLEKVAPMLRAKGLAVSLFTDSSVERELARSSGADAGVIGISYAAMFLYIALAIGGMGRRGTGVHGELHRPVEGGLFADVPPLVQDDPGYVKTLRRLRARLILGLGGVALVALSVTSAAGACAYAGVRGSGIVAEVIPFLILAVGVDNLFLLVESVGAAHADLPLAAGTDELSREARTCAVISAGLEKAGPSILLSACCEVLCFCVSTLVGMPAVRAFALFASSGIAFNLVLQISAFPALLSLELRMQSREHAARVERARAGEGEGVYAALLGEAPEEGRDDAQEGGGAIATLTGDSNIENVSVWFVEDLLAPCLSIPAVQLGVLVLSGFLLLASVAEVVNHLHLGLEQESVLPQKSHLQAYFRDLASELRTGPPVWFVIEGGQPWANYSDVAVQNAICGANPGCDPGSMLSLLSEAARRPADTTLAAPATSWLDDYLLWARQPGCCRLWGDDAGNGSDAGAAGDSGLCPPEDQPPCSSEDGTSSGACQSCKACFPALEASDAGRLKGSEFARYVSHFFDAAPSAGCSKGGRGPYTGDVESWADRLPATRFRTMHTPLSTQADFIKAITHGQAMSARLGAAVAQVLDLARPARVYAHSVFYVFFDQYVGLVGEATSALGLCLTAISGCVLALTGSFRIALLVAASAAAVVIQLLGLMAVWGIELNALSLVNLAMAAGIAVEFSAHTAHRYAVDVGPLPADNPAAVDLLSSGLARRASRALRALRACGPAVLSGITLTKVVGISILRFAPSRVIVVYYYRLYLGLVAFGAFQGLAVLPVLLTLFGPV